MTLQTPTESNRTRPACQGLSGDRGSRDVESRKSRGSPRCCSSQALSVGVIAQCPPEAVDLATAPAAWWLCRVQPGGGGGHQKMCTGAVWAVSGWRRLRSGAGRYRRCHAAIPRGWRGIGGHVVHSGVGGVDHGVHVASGHEEGDGGGHVTWPSTAVVGRGRARSSRATSGRSVAGEQRQGDRSLGGAGSGPRSERE